jgi:sortase A
VRFWEDPLLRVGAVMMAFAVALTIVVLVATFALRAEPERAVASETGEPSVEPLRYRNDSPTQPSAEKSEAQPEPPKARPEPEPEPQPEPQPEPAPRPEPEPEREILPVAAADWPLPTDEEIENASGPRRYDLPSGAIMGLTVKALGVYNAPVFNSDGQWALTNGVAHVPETSLPWSSTPQRNVYLEGHRLGWPGTGSHLIFYRLNKLEEGDEVLLKDRGGSAYRYRVSETLVVNPDDVWVMGQVLDRDMVTLQTCTPFPTFEKRLVVRADRI